MAGQYVCQKTNKKLAYLDFEFTCPRKPFFTKNNVALLWSFMKATFSFVTVGSLKREKKKQDTCVNEKETGVTVKMQSVQVVMPRRPQRRRCSKGEQMRRKGT